MKNEILNEKPLEVFVILAETLAGWKSANSEESKKVLMDHYQCLSDLKTSNKLLLAGPTDIDLISLNKINPIGHTTGIIMLKTNSKEDAEELAFKEPFHVQGFRRNVVYSMKITITENGIFDALWKLINNHQ